MSEFVTTTHVTWTRPADTDDQWAGAGRVAVQTVGLPAHVSRPRGRGVTGTLDQEQVDAVILIEGVGYDLLIGDEITDTEGQVFNVMSVAPRVGLGLAHTVAEARRVKGGIG